MKICYISNSAAPSMNASSLQTAKLCEGLSRHGNDVTLILPNTGSRNDYFNPPQANNFGIWGAEGNYAPLVKKV